MSIRMKDESLIKSKFIKEGQIKVVMNVSVHVLSKMLWIFVKIQKITAFTLTTAFHSTCSLICDLATKGFLATDTIRNDRIPKCLLVAKKMKKNERGSFDFRRDGNIEIVRWNDNSVITIRSSAYGVQPVRSIGRWMKGKGKQNIWQPDVIAAYNQGRGAVDLFDCALSYLRPVIHGKKWYWPLVGNSINIAYAYNLRLYLIVSNETIP